MSIINTNRNRMGIILAFSLMGTLTVGLSTL